jgi:hypothetical protein
MPPTTRPAQHVHCRLQELGSVTIRDSPTSMDRKLKEMAPGAPLLAGHQAVDAKVCQPQQQQAVGA